MSLRIARMALACMALMSVGVAAQAQVPLRHTHYATPPASARRFNWSEGPPLPVHVTRSPGWRQRQRRKRAR